MPKKPKCECLAYLETEYKRRVDFGMFGQSDHSRAIQSGMVIAINLLRKQLGMKEIKLDGSHPDESI